MTPVQAETLARFRSRHRIEIVRDYNEDRGRFDDLCATDHLRVYRLRDGSLRHDTGEVARLARLERGESEW